MFSNQIKPNKDKAIFLAKRQLSELVHNAVNLEGIHMTLPEVQTLLEGVTIGGHTLNDQTIVLNQSKAWQKVFQWVSNDQFTVSKEITTTLHAIAGKEEALQWGKFRTGSVTIAGTDYQPPAANKLDQAWQTMVETINNVPDIYDQAIFVFLQMARNQFFYDVNKRMGRFMMNGMLLSNGYPAINVPYKKQLTFNQLMLDFYPSNHMEPMMDFMKTCLDEKIIAIMNEF